MPEISDWRSRIIRYRLVGSKCHGCNQVFYPPRYTCIKCGSEGLDEVELPKRGRVISYTVIHNPPREYEYNSPYIVAYIELENGVRIFSQLTDVDVNEVSIGMEVEATLRKLYEYGADGPIVYGIKFRPKC